MKHLVLLLLFIVVPTTYAADKTLVIPTDAKATYSILGIAGEWPNRTIITKRVGSSGTSYSKRLYNCSNHTVKYLGTGNTLEEMAESKPDKNMAPIVPKSIADYVGSHACKR